MVPTSRFVLRGAPAAAVAVLVSSLSGTIAVAQQVAVNTEDQAASEPSPDEERSGEADTRQIVPFHTSEAPGTIIIDTGERYLYLVQPNDLAIRYGIGVGRVALPAGGLQFRPFIVRLVDL
jgi:lipoprotein-anchoring transpeptidase ErfK/SrfK